MSGRADVVAALLAAHAEAFPLALHDPMADRCQQSGQRQVKTAQTQICLQAKLKDSQGMTALMWATRPGLLVSIVSRLHHGVIGATAARPRSCGRHEVVTG